MKKFFKEFLAAWIFSHQAENHGSKLQFIAKLGKYVVILPALLWLILHFSSCSCYEAVTVQGITPDGASAKHNINSKLKRHRKIIYYEGQRLELIELSGSDLTAQSDGIIFKFTVKK